MRATCFEDLIVWQKARWFAGQIYHHTSLPPFRGDLALRDQVRRASVSIMSNIAEGFDRFSSRDFRRFLRIAKGSAAEVRSQLYLARDLSYLQPDAFEQLSKEVLEISRMLAALHRTVRSS